MRISAYLTCLWLAFASFVVQAGSVEEKGWNLVQSGALLIDVRTPAEYADGALEGARNIPFQQIAETLHQEGVAKDRQIVVYCKSGRRSGIAEESLQQAGYSNVFNAGGYRSMLEAKPM